MIGDLPQLDDFFTNSSNNNIKELKDITSTLDDTIYIYISKENDKWMQADFISIAVAGIGIHVSLPIDIELTAKELNNARIRFINKKGDFEDILKELPVFVRWQERDVVTGKIKLGLHFSVEFKNDRILIDILKRLQKQ